MLFDTNGASLFGHATVEEEYSKPDRVDPRENRSQEMWSRRRSGGERIKRRAARLGHYFKLGPVSNAYRAIDSYAIRRLRRWLCKKHKVGGNGYTRYPDAYLAETLGLVRLPRLTHSFPWATA